MGVIEDHGVHATQDSEDRQEVRTMKVWIIESAEGTMDRVAHEDEPEKTAELFRPFFRMHYPESLA